MLHVVMGGIVAALAAIGAGVVAIVFGIPACSWTTSFLRRNLPRVLPITVCPSCRRWSPHWCNFTDWHGDGYDCDKSAFVRVNLDGSLRKTS